MMTAKQIQAALQKRATPAKAKASAWFFKTGPGQYGAGDIFIGVTVPEQRQVVKEFASAPLTEVIKLLHSQVHEYRLTALLIMVHQFEHAKDKKLREKIYKLYLANTRWINNWDLVDSTAPRIVGAWLGPKALPVLKRLARSKNLWEKRIAIISTLYLITKGEATPALVIAEMLLNDSHDLLHKATGWMLREVGKRCSEKQLTNFLDTHATTMPRTMLRYAIERFPKAKRLRYLQL